MTNDKINYNEQGQIIYTLYVHIFPNKFAYVGITKYIPKYRWGSNGGGYKKQMVYKPIKKYGWNNIEHLIIATSPDKAFIEEQERYYITEIYHSNERDKGYNIDLGGNYQGKISNMQKDTLRKANLGKKLSIEVKEKIRKAATGVKQSIETKQKHSIALKNKKKSDIHRLHLSLAHKGKSWWTNGKTTTLARECPGSGFIRGRKKIIID